MDYFEKGFFDGFSNMMAKKNMHKHRKEQKGLSNWHLNTYDHPQFLLCGHTKKWVLPSTVLKAGPKKTHDVASVWFLRVAKKKHIPSYY